MTAETSVSYSASFSGQIVASCDGDPGDERSLSYVGRKPAIHRVETAAPAGFNIVPPTMRSDAAARLAELAIRT